MKLALVLFVSFTLCTSTIAVAQTPEADSKAEVVETRVVHPCYQTGNSVSCLSALDIKAVIDGLTFWLEASKSKYQLKDGLLELGQYKVKLVTDEHPAAAKFQRLYTFFYPNGKSEDYYVIGELK